MMNGRYVQLDAQALISAFFASLIFVTLEKSTSNTECTWAEVRRLAIMCSAILLRMTVIGTISTASPGSPGGRLRRRLASTCGSGVGGRARLRHR